VVVEMGRQEKRGRDQGRGLRSSVRRRGAEEEEA